MFRIIRIADCAESEMKSGRGKQIKLVDDRLGTTSLDVHVNRLFPNAPRGKPHRHTRSDNVYIVTRGTGELIVEDKVYQLEEGEVVFIAAGVRHSLSNTSADVFELFEIYSPAGDDFDFVT